MGYNAQKQILGDIRSMTGQKNPRSSFIVPKPPSVPPMGRTMNDAYKIVGDAARKAVPAPVRGLGQVAKQAQGFFHNSIGKKK